MKYAIIQSSGKQYVAMEGDSLLVDNLNTEKGEEVDFPDVLLVRDEESIIVGNPYIPKALVKGKVLELVKGEKVTTVKFKAKVHYRRKIGFRAQYSKIAIDSIHVGK